MYRNFRVILFLLLVFVAFLQTFSQDRFNIQRSGKSYAMSFKMINNLIVIPIEVNGSKLNFLLDTGVNKTIMFNLSVEDSTKLKNTKKIRIRGLGKGSYIDAVQSKNNLFRIGKIINGQHMIYLIPGKEFDLSARMGIDINGIVGGGLFKDFIIDINYTSKRLKFYNPKTYKYKKCRKCEIYNLTFNRNKPYIDIKVKQHDNIITTKLLIDTGGSKALWLFDKSDEKITLPKKYFDDYLGKGLSGDIYGKRSKIDEIILGKYSFKNANVAYPDSSSIATAYRYKERNGSLGAGILKRFRLLVDYRDKKLVLKKKSRYYKDPFVYNMSGIDLIRDGNILIKSDKANNILLGGKDETKPIVQVLFELVYDFKPLYVISHIRKNSPAERAGLLPNDIILQINGRAAYNYKLEEIVYMLSTKVGKQIKLLIQRNDKKLFYSFKLEDLLK